MAFFDTLLSGLVNDPTQPGGGWLAQLLGTSPTASTSTPTLAAPPVGQGTSSTQPLLPPGSPAIPNAATTGGGPLNLMQFFRPRTGLLGNSILGDALRGGFQGLGASTGYTGGAALGQGFMGADAAARQRQAAQMATLGAGQQFQSGQNALAYQPAQLAQQYQKGQVDLATARLGLQWKADQLNYLWEQANPGQTNPHPYTVDDILANPSLGGPAAAPSAPSAPGQTAPTQPAPSQPGAGGGLTSQGTIAAPGSGSTFLPGAQSAAPVVTTLLGPPTPPGPPNLAAAPGRVPGSAAALPLGPPQQPAPPPRQPARSFVGGGPAAIPTAPGQTAPAPAPAPATPAAPPPAPARTFPTVDQIPVPAGMKAALTSAFYSGDPAKYSEEQQKIADYQATTWQKLVDNITNLKSSYTSQKPVQTMQEVQPIYDQAMAAEQAHKAAKSKDEQLASDMDLTNSMLKLWNPNNANLRPNTAEAVQEAMGWSAQYAKLKQQIMGGTGLSPEVRATMINSMKSHYAAYKSDYNQTVSNFRKQAQLYGNLDESWWRPDAPQLTTPVHIGGPDDYNNLEPGQHYFPPDGGPERVKQ